jgi:hypothetical protein
VNDGLPPYSTESPAVVPADKPVNLWLAIGKFAVIVCDPSFNTQVLNAVAISELVVLVVVDEIVVPVTTGFPDGSEYVPEVKGIFIPYFDWFHSL